RLQALAYVVGMAAVRAGDAIGPGQGGGGADAYRFLAVAAMYGPARLARLVQLAQALLQPSRQYHAAVHLQPQLQGGKIAHLSHLIKNSKVQWPRAIPRRADLLRAPPPTFQGKRHSIADPRASPAPGLKAHCGPP